MLMKGSAPVFGDRRSHQADGVGVIITTPNAQRVLMVTEMESKPWLGKEVGDLSFPMETCEPGELPHQARQRLLDEEVPGLELAGLSFEDNPAGIFEVVSGVFLLVYWGRVYYPVKPLPSPRGDVANPQWMTPNEACACKLRRGALEPLAKRIAQVRFRGICHCESYQIALRLSQQANV